MEGRHQAGAISARTSVSIMVNSLPTSAAGWMFVLWDMMLQPSEAA
tara:strand:+ start:648 stop:785 length:138 start_codon:yes stop_codon:yes gene_type:complete